jgi:hypothetical protein
MACDHPAAKSTTQKWNHACASLPRASSPIRWVFSNWKVALFILGIVWLVKLTFYALVALVAPILLTGKGIAVGWDAYQRHRTGKVTTVPSEQD